MNTIIISGGNIDIEFLNKTLTNFSYDNIIAVDKGLETLYLLKILPTHIVGDFDSVNETIINFYNTKNIPIHKYNPEKDYTDTDIAIKLAISLNSTNITIIGATGTRLDHTLANIHILCNCLEKKISCEIIDPHNKIYLIDSKINLEKSTIYGKYISLIPLTSKVLNVTLKGFKYPLQDYTLKIGESLGISNEVVNDVATIEIKEGILIVIESRD